MSFLSMALTLSTGHNFFPTNEDSDLMIGCRVLGLIMFKHSAGCSL
jgi:hypothetical protein